MEWNQLEGMPGIKSNFQHLYVTIGTHFTLIDFGFQPAGLLVTLSL